MMGSGRVRAGLYSRVSTLSDEQAGALENHVVRLRDFASARGYAVAECHVFTDRASGGTANRPGYQALLETARKGKIGVVVAVRLDRLTRSLRDLLDLVDRLDAYGVALVLVDQPLDTTTALGRTMLKMVGLLGELEREWTRERVKKGLETARKRGKRLGRPSPVVDMEEVRRLRAKGLSLKKIAERVRGRLRGRPVQVSPTWLSRRLRDPLQKAQDKLRDVGAKGA